MLKVRTAVLVLSLGILSQPVLAQNRVTASEAKDHVGEVATVCGDVASTHYASSTKGQPTFLNLDKPYPSSLYHPDLGKQSEQVWTGKITEYRGGPEIVADKPEQIKLDSR
jgi:hypothetical protein